MSTRRRSRSRSRSRSPHRSSRSSHDRDRDRNRHRDHDRDRDRDRDRHRDKHRDTHSRHRDRDDDRGRDKDKDKLHHDKRREEKHDKDASHQGDSSAFAFTAAQLAEFLNEVLNSKQKLAVKTENFLQFFDQSSFQLIPQAAPSLQRSENNLIIDLESFKTIFQEGESSFKVSNRTFLEVKKGEPSYAIDLLVFENEIAMLWVLKEEKGKVVELRSIEDSNKGELFNLATDKNANTLDKLQSNAVYQKILSETKERVKSSVTVHFNDYRDIPVIM
eukprot:TRINITY_DN5599_c0_g1_i1.p1 TRINITY_DN5599_c0_g1~~TRINITY_DN5599_c0_g1_i1.p1  ORF type:complete len:289 (-),score=83.21 TRINITY_DN5599_c0_g1_i1:74-898(-)